MPRSFGRYPELRKYIGVDRAAIVGRNNHEPHCDGISEAWFDDEATIRSTADSPRLRAAITDDAKFIDMSTAGSIIIDEIVQKEGARR